LNATPWIDERNLGLFTDLYELTMAQVYVEQEMMAPATFSLFVRRLPERRNYLLACGLEDVVRYLEGLRFDAEACAHIASVGDFGPRFLDWLKRFRFSGWVRAVPEGTVVFADEPILEVTAPIAEAQIIETFVMNQVHLQTVLASKAARVVTAAAGRPVVDFGPRRMHGTDAAIKAARAFFIAGVAASSNVFANRVYGVPAAGTMAHSFIQACDDEQAAFALFLRRYPGTVLLVDTFDTIRGVERVCALAAALGPNERPRAIRLDSGDLAALARAARERLDRAGLASVEIIASSSLDEDRIATLVAEGAPIDGFGVGTKMGVSEDAASLDIAYKLCAYAGRGRLKTSSGKPILPGPKQVFRREQAGRFSGDTIAREREELPGTPLLHPVMEDGRRLAAGGEPLHAARQRAAAQIARLPEAVRGLAPARTPYSVEVSAALRSYQREVIARTAH
jgi:nicotinate phosphoribosyltransferase